MNSKKENTKTVLLSGKKLTRKEALSKAGLMAIAGATSIMLLTTNKAHAGSAPAAPSTPSGSGTWTKRN